MMAGQYLLVLNIVAVLALVLAADDDQHRREASDDVLDNRDLLDQILGRIPLTEQQFFNQESRDLVRMRRFLDPAVTGPPWAHAVRALTPPERYREDLRSALNSWPVAIRITKKLLRLNNGGSLMDGLVLLAGRLISDLQLDRVGGLLPGMAVRLGYPMHSVIRFLQVAGPVAESPQLPHDIVDLVSAAVDAAMVLWLNPDGEFPVYDTPPDVVLAQWRVNTTTMSYGQVRSSLKRKLKQVPITSALMSDVRLFYRKFILKFDRYFAGYPAQVRTDFDRIFPEPFSYISIDPSGISSYVLHHMSPSQRMDTTLLVSLRHVGVAFSVFDFMQQIRDTNTDLTQIVPHLENVRALETIRALTEQDRVHELEVMIKIPEFVTELRGHEYSRFEMFQLIISLIQNGQTSAFRTLATLEDVRVCYRRRLHYADAWGSLLHFAAQYDRLEIAEILLKYSPELANEIDSLGRVPLQMVSDRRSRIYQLIKSYTTTK